MLEMHRFDPCLHLVQMMMLAFGRVLFPDEKDVKKLMEMVSAKIGMNPFSADLSGSSLPSPLPLDSKRGQPLPKLELPKKLCVSCGKENGMQLRGICVSCKDAEVDPVTKKPKYRTMWFCGDQDLTGKLVEGTGCGYSEKSEKHISQWFTELNFDFQNANKAALGIKTVTDEGLK